MGATSLNLRTTIGFDRDTLQDAHHCKGISPLRIGTEDAFFLQKDPSLSACKDDDESAKVHEGLDILLHLTHRYESRGIYPLILKEYVDSVQDCK